ncbi:glycoside hydrolase family 2 protein [Novosphingobium sp. TCA1]|uniref:glycoside hydrolase family 2 protein n=1 Tax=Novosphingobium sp. TCA1 TaxID=2682474 RepID=UPI0013061536|nr:sugar-binding domain-containing protein [Novosphingobium sp. TCA1]GFE76015.1 hydrolase [Novosphingobium sp. TCA1]
MRVRNLKLLASTLLLSGMTAPPALAQIQGDLDQTGPVIHETDLMTSWGRAVTAQNAWRSYPRPQMVRSQWLNLNGQWDYAIAKDAAGKPSAAQGKILVPFAVESRLSGVRKPLMPDDRLWYSRSFTVPSDWSGQNVLLHFGAVDYAAEVWVNGALVGSHKGGFTPFKFDVTHYLKPGDNTLEVRVADPTSEGSQARGKQALNPHGIWYTPVSGIWQTVWLEPVPALHIAEVRAVPDIDKGRLDVEVALSGEARDGDAVRLTARAGGKVIATRIVRAGRHAALDIPDAHLWSPDDPYLYDLVAELVTVEPPLGGEDKEAAAQRRKIRFTEKEAQAYAALTPRGGARDTVKSYFAMRKISIGRGPVEGQPAMLLNNKPLFQNGVLDQGWWPDGLLTPPSEEAMRSDIVFLKKAGFNMLRKHIKIEPAQYYADADRLGILIWQDMPMAGREGQFVVGASQSQAVFSSEDMAQQQFELSSMIGHLRAFPSIVTWVVDNEGWGQYDSRTLARFVKGMDPSRLVDADSGWLDVAADSSDLRDIHTYEEVPNRPGRDSARAIAIGEYGGIGLPMREHLWRPGERNWGYQSATDAADYQARYRQKFAEIVRQAKEEGLSAAVYTQTTDVEDEINGLLTYDRAKSKIPAEEFAKLAAPLYAPQKR